MKKQNTRRALIMSVLSLVLCASMLVGTTFAWFTDSVTSGKNKIVAGNLDVELLYSKDLVSWDSVSGKTDLFDDKALWEPGHTEIVYLKVENLGSLALKYQFNTFFKDTVIGKSVLGNDIALSEYLEFGIVNGVTAKFATRSDARKAVTGAPLSAFVNAGELKAGEESEVMAYVIYMPETVGNEANHVTGTAAPEIELGVNLVATQLTHEEDSFDNQYDANAAFSVWNGTVPASLPESLVVDKATQTITVKDAEAFVSLSNLTAKWAELYTDGNGRTYSNYANAAGAEYYYRGNWSISLEADIDLANHAIAPIDLAIGENTGALAFKGNNHVIRNINTTTGLFADATPASFADLVLENVKASNGALIGSAHHAITNVTVKNATVSGTDYVGGLVGYSYGGVTESEVLNSTVIASGKEAGGLVGYIVTSNDLAKVKNNTVSDVTVYANNRAAGLIAQVNVKVEVFNNTVKNTTVGAEDVSKYAAAAVVSNALDASLVHDNTVIGGSAQGGGFAIASDKNEMAEALKAGETTLVLTAGDYVIPAEAQGKTLTIKGTEDTKVAVTKVGSGGENCDYGLDGSTVTFEGVTITTNSSTYIGYARMKGIYNNCTFNGTYTLYDNSEFNDCTFNVSGDVYNVWTWGASVATFNGCTFNNDGKAILLYGTANTNLTVNKCTFNDNGGLADLKAAIEIGNDYGKSYTLTVNETVVNGYEINDKGISTGTTLWANKNSMGKDKLNVVVDGVDVY